jgi:hypothetical protein
VWRALLGGTATTLLEKTPLQLPVFELFVSPWAGGLRCGEAAEGTVDSGARVRGLRIDIAIREVSMPEKATIERARKDAREGKAPSTQAGEFVREEMHHVREGKHGARSTKQAIAIGLSKARRAGVKLEKPKRGTVSKQTLRQAARDTAKGRSGAKRTVSARRSRAVSKALRREGHSAASPGALAKQVRSSARRRSATQRSAAAKKAARTKGTAGRSAAARKAARTRARA